MGWLNGLVDKLDALKKFKKDDSVIDGANFNFKFDQQLKLEFEYNGKVVNCQTKIDDVQNETIKVLLPSSEGRPCKLEKGHELNVTLLDSTGLYMFESLVLKASDLATNSLSIQRPEKMQRFEQRRSVRVWASMPVLCKLESIDVEGLPKVAEVWSKDISANGICFVTEWPLPLNSNMKIKFTLPKGAGTVEANIRIARCVQDVLPEKFIVGAEFTALTIENLKSIKQFVEMRLRKL